MRHLLTQPSDSDYFNKEAWLNELTVLLLSASTVKAVAVGIVDSGGNQITPHSIATSIGDGRQTVTTSGTEVQLSTSSVACNKVTITAETDNTGVIVIGTSTVVAALATRRGVPLNAGDSYTIEISNLNLIYLDSIVNGDGVTYTYTA